MNIKQLLQQPAAAPWLLQARFGIEKESQRVTLDGQLAKTDHPSVLGDRLYHPYIQTDFAETQLELVTAVFDSVPEVLNNLAAIHDVAQRSMAKDEMMWPLSMPPALPENEQEIFIAKLKRPEDLLYRRYLAKIYGKRKQMVSGIHFNFEFGAQLVKTLFNQQEEITELQDFKTELYLKLARNFLHYRWLLTYLFGASPVSEQNYFKDHAAPTEPVRSIRSSQFGYVNEPDVKVSYSSLAQYLEDLETMVETGKLSEEKEFYSGIRLRGGQKVAELGENGIRYVELRTIDLNPYERIGISEKEVQFIHLFMLYLIWTEDKKTDEWLTMGEEYNNQVALEHPLTQTKYLAEGKQIFSEMQEMLNVLDLASEKELVLEMAEILDHPEWTLAGCLLNDSQASSQADVAVNLGHKYYDQAYARPYQLAGYTDMELSTQNLMFDAIQKGLNIELLDQQDQFLRLYHKTHTEYVKNANMTAKDTYIAPLIMANKTVTKKILHQDGFNVPLGLEFSEETSAQKAYVKFAKQAFVVKPKSTNYGVGISIFKHGATKEDYYTALKLAFAEDDAVIIEEFLVGTEYRFFVIDGVVKAVLLRVPANVKGDGKQTIRELVKEKNQDPLRGTHHRAPLEKIQLGQLENLMLKEQGLTPESIPQAGEVVYLRENSNISTGGDSIDVTDDVHESYKKIASDAVAALGAKISGIDLVIPDRTRSGNYGIIEANYNPAMHMHLYPYAGKKRRLTMDVLHFLFPELI